MPTQASDRQTQISERLHFEHTWTAYRPKPGYELVKRIVETTVAIMVLVLFAPLWLVVALTIKLTSPGPILYQGRVVGRYGREFTYYKFRSMRHNNDNSQHKAFIENYVKQHLVVKPEPVELALFGDNETAKLNRTQINASADSGELAAFGDNETLKLFLEKTSANEIIVEGYEENPTLHLQKSHLHLHVEGKPVTAHFKLTNDERVTRIGRLIRKLSIDEMPQMFNVIRGEMAIVGPRPPVPYEYSLYDDSCKQRLLVRPGITGLAQVQARGKATFQEMLTYDFEYIEKRSIRLDLATMLRTPLAMLKGA